MSRLQPEPVLPPKTHQSRTSTPPTNCYTDYRNDCFSKQEQKAVTSDQHSVTIHDSKIETGSVLLNPADGTGDIQLKSIKNIPPLPRRKKRHRRSRMLCCFRSEDLQGSDYS